MKKLTQWVLPGLCVLGLVVGASPASAGNTAGTLDTSFGTGGVTIINLGSSVTFPNSILAQNNGEILVLVQPENATGGELLRFTANGALDPTFGSQGVAALAAGIGASMAVQPNGQIVIGGVVTNPSTGAVLGVERLNSDGTRDASFGSDGWRRHRFVMSAFLGVGGLWPRSESQTC